MRSHPSRLTPQTCVWAGPRQSNRTFVLEDLQGDASKWVDMIAGMLASHPPA